MLIFEPGAKYTRADVKVLAGLPRNAKGGPWDTGIVEHDSEFIIFANVGIEGRTGHDYNNRWDGNHFRWSHRNGSSLSWSSVKRLNEEGKRVHLFWRDSNSAPFEYAGLATAVQVLDMTPVEFLWSFRTEYISESFFQGPDEVQHHEYVEGSMHEVSVNVYERDPLARQACIEHYGTGCAVCGLRFEERYGSIGAGYIHVHHLVPLSSIGEKYEVDPVQDLRPICPNCHAMVHQRHPPYSIEEIGEMLLEIWPADATVRPDF